MNHVNPLRLHATLWNCLSLLRGFASVTTVTGSVIQSSLSDCEGSREAANLLLSKLRVLK